MVYAERMNKHKKTHILTSIDVLSRSRAKRVTAEITPALP